MESLGRQYLETVFAPSNTSLLNFPISVHAVGAIVQVLLDLLPEMAVEAIAMERRQVVEHGAAAELFDHPFGRAAGKQIRTDADRRDECQRPQADIAEHSPTRDAVTSLRNRMDRPARTGGPFSGSGMAVVHRDKIGRGGGGEWPLCAYKKARSVDIITHAPN